MLFVNSFDRTYKDNYLYLLRIALKMTSDENQAKDIVQEVFTSYYENVVRSNIIIYPKAWLVRAVINKCIDCNKRSLKFVDLETIESNPASDCYLFEKTENEQILKKALQCLSGKERSIAVLYSENNSYRNIAEITGINYKSVGKTLSRTLKKLDAKLKELGYEMS